MRILVIEDEKKIASFICRGLREEAYAVDVSHTLDRAGELLAVNEYDLVVLDIMLPDGDGILFLKERRCGGFSVPVLMLTAKGRTDDKIKGLDAGADDYLTKPFEFEEFLARVRALLRRRGEKKSTLLKVADLELDQATRKVTRSGEPIALSAREYALLEYLMLNSDTVVTRTMLSEHVWNEDFDSFTNVIDVYINYLRKKIDRPFGLRLLQTVRGAGYMLSEKRP